MVKVPVTVGENTFDLYMDGKLHNDLTKKVHKVVTKKDKDWVICVDGGEGTGKSVFATHIGIIVDPTLTVERVCFTPEQFRDSIIKAKKGQCVIFDEAFTGLSSRSSLNKINKLLVALMQQMRQKNLFVVIVLPSFFLLDKYVALFRSRGLFHVYEKQGQRGYWQYYNTARKKHLYLKGKLLYSYREPRTPVRGRFLDQYGVDQVAYRKKKADALKLMEQDKPEVDPYINQRNALIDIAHREGKLSLRHIAQAMKKRGESVTHQALSVARRKFAKKPPKQSSEEPPEMALPPQIQA